METTTNPLDVTIDPVFADMVRRRVEETPEGPKEFCEMRVNLDPEGDWVECPADSVTLIKTLSAGRFSVRAALLNIVQAHRLRALSQQDGRDWANKFDGAQIKHYQDIETIRDRLVQEAEDRGWCSEFDDIIAEVNSRLHVEMDPRQKEFELTVTFSVVGSRTVNVLARDLDEAVDNVKQNYDELMDIEAAASEAALYGNFEIIDVEQY